MAMSLADLVPPRNCTALARSGYALLTDLDDPEFGAVLRAMEEYQLELLSLSRQVWRPGLGFTGDVLYHYSRQWEYPYAWVNLGLSQGAVLDAGSGITFFPFLLASAGLRVSCSDSDGSLASFYREVCAATGQRVEFCADSITNMHWPDGSFDGVACLSVLEHVGEARDRVAEELARVLRPGGRLVLTCDLSLERDSEMLLEDLAMMILALRRRFRFSYPLDLHRPAALLTSDHFLREAPWRLPWRREPVSASSILRLRANRRDFRSLTVLGLTAEKT